MTKAFGYIRVSGRGQLKGDGFTRQREAIKAYAAANGIKIVRWFEEEGIAGKTEWEDRPAWIAMMAELNGTRTVLVEKLDRVARDLMVQEHIIADLRKRQVQLVSVTEPAIDEDPTRVLMRQIMGAIAQYDKAMIVLKLRGARQRMKAKTGRCEGAKPFEDQVVIGKMQAMRSNGMSFDRIADALNTEGVKPKRGERWYGSSVNNVLRRMVE